MNGEIVEDFKESLLAHMLTQFYLNITITLHFFKQTLIVFVFMI